VGKQSSKVRKAGGVSDQNIVRGASNRAEAEQLPTILHLASQSSVSDMGPGDIVFLDDFAYLREAFAPNFVAVLGCPLCGTPGMITAAQYSGAASVVCVSNLCSGLFRILEESQIVYLLPG
jgi:hypothetical protein